MVHDRLGVTFHDSLPCCLPSRGKIKQQNCQGKSCSVQHSMEGSVPA